MSTRVRAPLVFATAAIVITIAALLVMLPPSLILPAAKATTPAVWSVSGLLRELPSSGQVVELDAYASPFLFVERAPVAGPCPTHGTALTDRPAPRPAGVGIETPLPMIPSTVDWVVAVTPAGDPAISPPLPYHARFRGSLGHAAFPHCRQLFVVDAVVAVYEEHAPAP